MPDTGARPAVIQPEFQEKVLTEFAKLNGRVDVLNTRLLGNPDGEPGDDGRLVIAERRVNNHSERLQEIEKHNVPEMARKLASLDRWRWLVVGGLIVADALFMYALALWSVAKK
jgi:hypothetical protein